MHLKRLPGTRIVCGIRRGRTLRPYTSHSALRRKSKVRRKKVPTANAAACIPEQPARRQVFQVKRSICRGGQSTGVESGF